MNSFLKTLRRSSALFFAAAFFLLAAIVSARAVNLVQEFYLPMPEAQINQANNAIISGTSTSINSIFSIVITGDGTVIYYDQWEDGYETDLSNPTQSTTLKWGDGNDADGIPPGFAHNPNGLAAGTVITLTNVVTQPRNPSQFLWDARDRIGANKALVITRAGWPTTPGPVFAGAVGVLSTIDYGTNFISPVGQNITNNLFKYVGMSIMAAQNNTTVTIDLNGTGVGTTNIVLNQGESYLVNGGIMIGGRVTATKGIQADLIIGHVGASYAADWFTLYPASEWSSSYYTPVGSAATVTQPAYVYLYNPNTNTITVRYTTKVSSGSVSVPGTNGVYQFQMPVGSGANFTTTNAQNFYALCTVAANNSADTAYNWGFTLVPQGSLTTEATVGWGPGSADGTVDGSPVWITALANTTLYVDYKGDHAGPLSYTNNGIIQNYDTNFTITALQSLKIFDPSKNQTGMRVFTVDGTLIAGAWGEDPDTAAPGNPYIDAGTTVIPFPVPTLIKSVSFVTDAPPTGLSLNDILAYSVQINNQGLLPLGNTVVIDAPSGNLSYVSNSTTLNGVAIPDNVGVTNFPLASPGYTIPIILSQGVSTFKYQVKVIGSGTVSNSVNIGGTTIMAQTTIPPGITNASLSLNFTDTNGVPVTTYAAGTNIYVTMTNALANTSSNTIQTINVTVIDLTSGDLQTITLTETGTNSGVFRNITGLPTSTSSGIPQQDGILNVAPADTLQVAYTDPIYLDGSTNTASILVPTLKKQLYLSANGVATNQFLNRINPSATAGHGTNYTSVDIGSAAGSITVLSTNSATNGPSVSTMTLSNVVVPAASSELLLVGVSFNPGSTVSGISYGAKSLSLVTRSSDNNLVGAEIWGLTNPPVGTTNVVISFASAATSITAGALVLSGVNQTTPYSATSTNLATSSTPTVTIASAVGEMVFNSISVRGATAASPSGSGQVKYWSLPSQSGTINLGAVSLMPGASSVTNSWTTTSGTSWSSCAVSIKPAAGGGGPTTNTTSFVQTPAFALPFTMPAGGAVSITNFITITNGAAALAASPNLITATLQANGVNFLTLTNTTLVGNTNLIWSGLLSSSVTIPTNVAITYVISNNVINSAFHINYDTTNSSSEIVLPASTVISIVTNGVYDAPYPGGNSINSPVAGSTVYVRTVVTDPFGSSDITSLGVNITGPVSLSTNLTDVNVVYSSGAMKIYEYAVTTGPNTGTYNIAVTANEGTEGVNVSAATSITTTFLDLGTPSITQFTAGPNGVSTNSYAANGTVSIRVSDLNRNTNAATIDAISVLVTNTSGDFETLTLVETGTNTGIFTNSLPASSTVVGSPNNGTLYAPVGSILTVYYSDPTDPTDNTSATATVLPPPGVAGVVMNKTILSPSGGQVGVSNNITFNLQAINTGNTNLPSLSISDTFPTAKLSFVSASLAPSTTNLVTGLLTWTNLGVFTPGQSTNITVTFLTIATGAATNFATANGVTATNTSPATFAVNKTALNVTKILLSPTNTPVAVGSNVVFRITVQNTGNVTVNYLPLEDSFSAAYYQFVSSTITNNGSGAGSLIWTNLASPTALVAGATITNDVTMKVVGQGSPANNTATVDYATDINGNAVPTTLSTIGVTTASASINGHVYNDINQSGVFTNGDTGLANVTLQLYTDPTGTGTPGTLVQVVTTDGNGYYELLNLNTGHYVVVETDLPGYSSSSPANNRLALNLTTLTATTNANFFDYIPAPAVYSTISGAVWNDANGNGTNNVGETNLPNVEIDLVQDVNSNGIADAGEPIVASTLTAGTNGTYTLSGVTPGHYVIREIDLYGYYSTGVSRGTNFNQIAFVSTNGIVSTNNNFYDRLSPVAVADTTTALYLVATNIYPLTNDISPNGDALVITNASSTNGIVIINAGSTNLIFTPTNLGVTTITYVIADAHGGTSTNTITVNVTALADLGIGKSALPTVFATSNLSYTISVTNFGPTPASSVVVTDALPVGVNFVSATGGGISNNAAVVWNLGTLTNNQITNLNLIVTAPAGGTLTNTASVSSPTPDPNLTNNVTPPVVTGVTPVTDVVILNAGPANVVAGTTYTNTLSVTNAGPSVATNVVVVDTRPDGSLVTNTIAVLPAGSGTNFIITYLAPGSGPLTNSATGSSTTFDPNLSNNTNIVAVTAVTAAADVFVSKTGPVGIVFGTNFNYMILVSNAGPSTASGISVTDSLPAGLVFVSAVPAAASTNSGVIVWTNISLIANATNNFILTVNSTARGSVTNIATGGSPIFDPNPTNNTSPPVVTAITNIPPVANPQLVTTPQNTAKQITLTGSDTGNLPLTFIMATSPAHGTLTLLNTNTGAVTYTPTNNYVGSDNFTFRVNNGQTNSLPATVSITVTSATGADVQVTLSGPTLVTVGDVFSFTNVVTNAGPATAVNTRVTNALPANLVFASATGGGVYSNGVVTWPAFTSLTNGQATNLVVSVKTTTSGTTTTPTANPLNFLLTNAPPAVNLTTNRASAFAATFDPNLTNNIASLFYTNAQAQTLIVPGAFSVVMQTNTYPTNVNPTYTVTPIGTGLFIVGTNAFNPQTQLYEEFVTVTNIGQAPVHALRLSIGNLRSGVQLYNATGTNNGVAYVEYDPPYDSPLNPYPQASCSVTFTLEFFVSDRRPFTNSLTAVAIQAPVNPPVNGVQVTILQSGFNDQRNPGNPRFLVQFSSVPGRTYTVQYSDDLTTWRNATPSIIASATSTFWYDDGPPVTVSPPTYPNSSRFYRVLLNP